jgi:hypothetical protein
LRWSTRSLAGRAPSCRGSGLTQGNWNVRFDISDGSVFTPPDAGLAFLVLGDEDVEGGLWAPLRLAPFILLPMVVLRVFRFDHSRWPLFSYDDLFALGRLGLRWPNQDLLPVELNHVHVRREWVFVELHLGFFLQISIFLRLCPIEHVDGKHCSR